MLFLVPLQSLRSLEGQKWIAWEEVPHPRKHRWCARRVPLSRPMSVLRAGPDIIRGRLGKLENKTTQWHPAPFALCCQRDGGAQGG